MSVVYGYELVHHRISSIFYVISKGHVKITRRNHPLITIANTLDADSDLAGEVIEVRSNMGYVDIDFQRVLVVEVSKENEMR